MMYFTLPVDVCHYLAACLDAGQVFFVSCSVLVEEKTRGACFLYLFEYLAQLVRPVEEQDEYGYIDQCGMSGISDGFVMSGSRILHNAIGI